jgi:hypothetical protein
MKKGNLHNIVRMTLFVLGVLMITSNILYASSVTKPPTGHRIWDKKYLDINRWRCPFYNDGRYAYDEATGEGGGFWPYPLQNCYIFGAGPWVGAILGNDTLVTCGYNPNTARGEFFPTPAFDWQTGTGNAFDRVYKYPTDWPPPQSRFGADTSLVPQQSFSLQDMWCVYCDESQDYHVSPGQPLHVEVYQTIYAWNYPTNQDIFFISYKIKNAGTDTIKKMILGACMDPDIGESGYQVPEEGDMVGLIKVKFIGGDTIRDVVYVGDYNNLETNPQYWQSGTPGVVAYKFLEGARDENGNPFGMTAAKKFTIDIDPPRDVDQYLTMAGYDYRTGVYSPFDSIDEQAADKRFITCTGTFDLPPGEVANILVACLAAPYGSAGELWPNRDTNDLKPLCQLAATAQFIYDQNWLLPGPPSASNAVLIPMDHAIRIVWDDLAERTPDPYYDIASDPGPNFPAETLASWDPAYRQYDFEGYKVYKSADGLSWSLLTQCDLANGITFTDSTAPESVRTIANDHGLFYSYNDANVTNGFVYYYRVASYDYNFTSIKDTQPWRTDTISFESNPQPVSARPRWQAPNYSNPFVTILHTAGDNVTPGLRCSTKIVTPYEITQDTLTIQFAGPIYGGSPLIAIYRYTVNCGDSLVLDTVRVSYTIGTNLTRSLPPVGGTEIIALLSIPIPSRVYDTIYPLSGNYPAERLSQRSATLGFGQWAFRGSDYKIVWRVIGGIKTMQVFDMTNGGIEVPKTRFENFQRYDSMANGWCFVNRIFRSPTDTLKTSTSMIYLNHGYIALNYYASIYDTIGAYMNQINDGDEWYVKAYAGNRSAPYYNSFALFGEPTIPRTDTTYKLNVKVVPNPYIVTNRWEISRFERRIAFTHLPANCKIRIYTLAGNLVKIIEHTDTENHPMDLGGTEYWDLLNEHDQLISSGVYVFHIESDVGEQIGKFAIVQ